TETHSLVGEHSPKILAFHKLTSSITFGATNFTPRRFENLIKFLLQLGFSFRSLEDITGTPAKDSLSITFDDGYIHLIESLPPLMERFNLKPTVFIPTDFIGRKNSWDYSSFLRSDQHLDVAQIRELSSIGVKFGSHGARHTDLTHCSANKLRTEMLGSKTTLEDILGQAVNSISYPFGRFNRNVIQAAAEAGYNYGFSMNFPGASDDDLCRGRFAVYAYDTHLSIQYKSQGGAFYQVERMKAAITNHLSYGTVLLNTLFRRS
ncbi:MAG: hypothetical protein DRP47_11910, partial [Candidatus Zixiibacteriota bacterium]